jgi:hypothetical protein
MWHRTDSSGVARESAQWFFLGMGTGSNEQPRSGTPSNASLRSAGPTPLRAGCVRPFMLTPRKWQCRSTCPGMEMIEIRTGYLLPPFAAAVVLVAVVVMFSGRFNSSVS